jgi:feruloyl-CoA synthase
MPKPPSPDAGEVTHKGYINQRAVQERRVSHVQRLYTAEPAPEVITPVSNR